MRALTINSKNDACGNLKHIRGGRAKLSLVASLFLLLSIALAMAPSAIADDPMNPSPGTPKIDPFQSTRVMVDEELGLYEFSIIGSLIDCDFPEGKTISIAGGPFTGTTTLDSSGAFTFTFLLPFADGIGQTVSGVMQENGQNASEVVYLTVD